MHTIPSPRDEIYWDRDALIAEEKRVFQICNGCRLCWNLCPSFPALFEAVDAIEKEIAPGSGAEEDGGAAPAGDAPGHDGAHAAEVRDDVHAQQEALARLPLEVHQRVVDLCYQCKLCDPICPYQPPHEHAVDFPRLMLRHRAVDAREQGVRFQDRILGDPDLVGRLGTLLPAVANWGSRVRANRVLMEKIIGIHRDRKLPPFASEPFRTWFTRTHRDQPPPEEVEGRKVVLFYTCTVQWNHPEVGRAAVEVLERSGVTVYAPELRCCGMPALDGGDVPRATEHARANVEVLLPYVRAGCDVLSPGPTCSFMLKNEWKDYLGTPEAEEVAARGRDLMEYIHELRRAGELDMDFQGTFGRINVHLPCHLKVQRIGFRSRDVLRRLPGAEVHLVDRCSCMDGTWGMKKDTYELSKEWAGRAIEEMTAGEPQHMTSDCLIARLQFEEATGRKVPHPIEVLASAYRDDDAKEEG